jgi:hypothetical protein
MASNPVIIFGAGATKACGGPLTNEILFDLFNHQQRLEREGFLDELDKFLVDSFNVPQGVGQRDKVHYPGLPLLLSLLDVSIDKKQPMGKAWGTDNLVHIRDALEYGVFALLEHKLRRLSANYYFELFYMLNDAGVEPKAISLNYDIIADNSMISVCEQSGREPGFPDYGCDIATQFYNKRPKFGTLYKIHGSLNWLYCPGCHRLELGISEASLNTVKVLNELYQENPLEPRYGCHGSECVECKTYVRPVLITPTHSKDYRNPHISQIWYKAERLLRGADRVIIIGYSLPEDDVDVIYMLKRGLDRLRRESPEMITVVEHDNQHRDISTHPTGLRYRSLFGEHIDWRTEGFKAWVLKHRQQNLNPIDGPIP